MLFRNVLHRDVGVREDLEETVQHDKRARRRLLPMTLTFKLSEIRC
jgi:hypothetical protein